ncbi:MAG: cell division protein FtsL [Proteobacteria bacterium]|nr:cell division protein FtsL [Pseudomonadota bacterium]
MKFKNLMIALTLALMNLVVIVNYVYLQHKTRNKFVNLQELIEIEQNLNADWGRLQIEHSTLVNNSQIEAKAKQQIGMKLPQNKNILSIQR